MYGSGAQVLIEMLHEAGVRHLFGNPGTTELPLMDTLARDNRLHYVLGLQEVPVLAMADGYAQASGGLSVVNLHISCGLGHGMGMLYNAFRAGTPMLVTAGQQDRRLMLEEPILYGDMTAVARPWTKWSVEVQRLADLPVVLRRAIHTALTPPTGPVFVSLPVDIQSELGELDTRLPKLVDSRIRPPSAVLERAAAVLAEARNPAILVGSRVVERGAVAELVRVAELLGAPVISESGTTHGRLSFPCDHPLSALGLPLWSPEVRARLDAHDVVLVTGMDLLRQYVYHEPARAIPEHVRLVHLDEDAWQLGKNYPVEVGLWGDTREGLAELAVRIEQQQSPAQTAEARRRFAEHAARHTAARESLRAQIAVETSEQPLTPLAFMGAIARVLPAGTAVVEEAVTTTGTVLERLGVISDPTGYFGHRGWALGWGLGCAIGVQLAWPQRRVLAILGEGATLYGVQGLWTAARYRIPVTFVIPNNAQYQILKVGAQGMQLPAALAGEFVGMDLAGPEIDLVMLARSLGVRAERVSDADSLAEAVRSSLAGDEPRLIEAPIRRMTPARLNYGNA